MPEVLSAGPTVYWCYKYGAPLAVVAFALATALTIEVPLGVLAAWLFVAVLAFLYGAQFKQVALLDNCLVVTRGKRSIHVPVGNIFSVSQSWGWNPQYVLIALRDASSVGRHIMFIPTRPGPFPPWMAMSVVRRLRRLSLEHPHTVCPHGT